MNMDRLVVLEETFPEWDVGAPCPAICADEHIVYLAYYRPDNAVAILRFHHCFEFRFGMPGEEQRFDNPLHEHGLVHYSAHVVEDSSWIAELEDRYEIISQFSMGEREYSHYIFTFHDRSFECVTSGYSILATQSTSVAGAIAEALTNGFA